MAPHILRIPSHSSHASHPPHILRFAAYVRGYGDGVFQTHCRWKLYEPSTKKASDCSDAFLYEEISIILDLRHHCCYCDGGGEDAQDDHLSQDDLPQHAQDVEAKPCVKA